MPISPLAGKPAPKELLVDLARLEREYFEGRPDLGDYSAITALNGRVYAAWTEKPPGQKPPGVASGLAASMTAAGMTAGPAAAASNPSTNGYVIFDDTAHVGAVHWDPIGGSSADATALVKPQHVNSLLPSDFHVV